MVRWQVALGMVIFGGCGPRLIDPEEQPIHPVRGKLLYEGRPTPNAIVKFRPVDSGAADAIPSARCQKDGTFQLSTYGKLGAPAGRYKVTVTWNKAGADGESSNDLPARYAKPETTDLPVVEIRSGDNELPVIELRR